MKIVNTIKENEYLVATIESDPSIFDKFFYSFFERARSNLKVSGFRRGKVPAEVAKQYINFEEINKSTFNAIVDTTLTNLKKTKKLMELDVFDEVVKSEVIDFKGEEKTITFKSYFETKPSVELADFKKIETIFEEYDPKSSFWLKEGSELNDKTVLYLNLAAYDAEKNHIFKYTHDHLQIDLANTKINPAIVEEIKKAPLKQPTKFNLKIDGKDIEFHCNVQAYLDKKELNEEAIKEMNNPEVTTVAQLKTFQVENFNTYNNEFKKNIIIKWANSFENKLSHIPSHNIAAEARKILQNFLKTAGRQYAKKTNLHQKFFENIFYENLSKIKIACVLEKVADDNKITVDPVKDKDHIDLIQKKPELAQLLIEHEEQREELVKSIVQQEKCLEFLKKNIIFSS